MRVSTEIAPQGNAGQRSSMGSRESWLTATLGGILRAPDTLEWCESQLRSHGIESPEDWADLENSSPQLVETVLSSLKERLTTVQIARVQLELRKPRL